MEQIKKSSTLSMKRIITSLALFILVPLVYYGLNYKIQNETLALMFAFNFGAWALIIYDWNLFGVHYNRAKKNLKDTCIYFLIGFVFLGAWAWFNVVFLKGQMLLPDIITVHEYRFAIPAILLAFSYMQAFIINITFKCLTDHWDIRSRELLIILLSGFTFGAIYTILFTPFDTVTFIRTLLYNIILVAFNSYLYNQSSSIIPGILSTGTVYLLLQILTVL